MEGGREKGGTLAGAGQINARKKKEIINVKKGGLRSISIEMRRATDLLHDTIGGGHPGLWT